MAAKKAAKKSAKKGKRKSPKKVHAHGDFSKMKPKRKLSDVTREAKRLARMPKFKKADEADKKAGRRPTSLLAAFLVKAPAHVADLSKTVENRLKAHPSK